MSGNLNQDRQDGDPHVSPIGINASDDPEVDLLKRRISAMSDDERDQGLRALSDFLVGSEVTEDDNSNSHVSLKGADCDTASLESNPGHQE